MRTTRARSEKGASAVEFALIAIPFIVLVIGMIQYGWFFYVSQSTGGAASNVARQLQVGNCWSGSEALDLAKKQSPMVTSVTKSPSTLSGLSAGDQITVTLQANAQLVGLVPLPGSGVINKTVYAQLQDTAPSGSCS